MGALVVCWLRRLAWTLLIAGVIAAGLAGWQRERLLAWYAVRGLLHADDSTRAGWIDRVAAHEQAALPQVLSAFRQPAPQACANARACVLQLSQAWQPDDPRRLHVSKQLARDFGVYSAEGQKTALDLNQSLSQSVPARFSPALTTMVLQAADVTDAQVHDQALTLALQLAGAEPSTPAVVQACRKLTKVCLRGAAPEMRARALRLALQPQIDLRGDVVPLLQDPSAEIRRAAMVVLGPETNVIATDDLLRWLHDPDPDVRHLCESALKGRGLTEEHIKMGKLMTDARVGARLKVLEALRSNSDLEPGLWLRRLSHDPSAAVRAAAMRMAVEEARLLGDRLEQMSQDDPDATVRQIARYYLACRKSD